MTKRKGRLSAGVDDLDNEDRIRVLGIIDQLRELGVQEDISLPQLVVVGDQSSGKSSLLEGLTGLSFPIAADLCTRFATQIVLRRVPADEASIKVSIIPGPAANENESLKLQLQNFRHECQGDDLTPEEFAKIMNEAASAMGLPSPTDRNLENLEKRFSDDILKIELSGPQHHHLSVVDIPGLFHNPTKYQTQEDLDTIRALIESYIVDSRTIILAVMDARNNLANQEVFRMARSADPDGLRTVGIITKCDAIQKGDEQGVLDIAMNTVERLRHGWFVVKNRSTQDIQNGVTIDERHGREKRFFETNPWNSIAKDRAGIGPLKIFLGVLLYNHIQLEFPGLVRDIRNLVVQSRDELDALGPSRQTFMDQRQFLTRLATIYQNQTRDCLFGNYHESFDKGDRRKLRMHLQLLAEEFGKNMQTKGQTRAFTNIDGSIDTETGESSQNSEDIYLWIRKTYRESRGSELPGTVNPSVLENMFRQQSSSWAEISTDYLAKVKKAVSEFNKAIFRELIPDDVLRNKLDASMQLKNNEVYEAASDSLSLILSDERGGILQTVNHYFAENLAAARQDRVLHRLQRLGISEGNVNIKNLRSIAKHLSNEDHAIENIHDTLKAYYKVALKRLNDYVIIQAVERHILGAEGPVKLFSPEYVGMLTETELSNLAGETYAMSNKRNEINARLMRLEKALSLAEAQRF